MRGLEVAVVRAGLSIVKSGGVAFPTLREATVSFAGSVES